MLEEDIDPSSFNLVSPCSSPISRYSLELRSEALFSKTHLQAIFDDPLLLRRFKDFLYAFRPKSVPLLVYCLDALKASKAIHYANAVSQSLAPIQGLEFSREAVPKTTNESLLEKTNEAFQTLTDEYLPAYITHTWIQIVGMTVKRRITGTLPDHLKDLSDGLAEIFCLTDPTRLDNPIIFASNGAYLNIGHPLAANWLNIILYRIPQDDTGKHSFNSKPTSLRLTGKTRMRGGKLYRIQTC